MTYLLVAPSHTKSTLVRRGSPPRTAARAVWVIVGRMATPLADLIMLAWNLVDKKQ
jgi:hypothetical protein